MRTLNNTEWGGRGNKLIPVKHSFIADKVCSCSLLPLPDTCAVDMDPPNVTCSNVTTKPFLVNSFLGLDFNIDYTNVDDNFDPSGVSYNVTIGGDGDLYPPGHTPVTLFANDTCDNVATCLFYVENTRKYEHLMLDSNG